MQEIKNTAMAQKQSHLKRRGNSIHLSSNMWDGMHQRKLSKSTLKELPNVQLSPRANVRFPGVTPIKNHTKRFLDKINQTVPRG